MEKRSLLLLRFSLAVSIALNFTGCGNVLSMSDFASAGPVVRIGDTVYATIHDAVEHASNGDTLVLLKDIEIDRTVEIRGKEITLIPEGNRTILRCSTFREELFYIAENGGLHLEGKDGKLTVDGNKEKTREALNVSSITTIFQCDEETLKKGIESLIKNEGQLSISDGVVLCNNEASFHNGGGIWNNGKFTMDGGCIRNNDTNFDGGGAYNGEKGTVFMNNGNIKKNKSVFLVYGSYRRDIFRNFYYGGGVYNEGKYIIKYGIISENKSCYAGGGIANRKEGELFFEDGEIYKNECNNRGGGIYNCGRKLCITGGRIHHNNSHMEGGGIWGAWKREYENSGGKIFKNEARIKKDIYKGWENL